ncbi:MAG: alkaline phosphatase [Balneolales bacterium]|nr:alkaline phosphatase [Balneolales bacterium]
MSNFSRRDFLKTGGLAGLLAGTTLAGCSVAGNGSSGNWRGGAKNVIFMVSDGMSIGTLSMADQLKRIQYGTASTWMSLYEENRVKRAMMDTASANSIVTDSAAGGSAWGCGVRVPNGMLNMGANGEVYTPILTHFRNAGKKTGLVTTTRLTHATPASFIVNMERRGNENGIAIQMLERGADVLMGGGDRFFDGEKREDGRDLFSEFASNGYHVARNKQEMNGASSDQPLLGVFTQEHLPYDVDHRNNPNLAANVPTLAEMTDKALQQLDNRNGFILQVEGGRVDHAAHGNCVSGLLYDQIAFDDAVAVALRFAEDNPDTLLIITTDHGNANPGLNGTGSGYLETQNMFMRLSEFTASNAVLLPKINRDSSISAIREVIEAHNKIAISVDEATMLRSAMRREFRSAYSRQSSTGAVMGGIMANHTAVSFVSGAHTSDHVELAAMGPGSEAINGLVHNNSLFNLVLDAAGVVAG